MKIEKETAVYNEESMNSEQMKKIDEANKKRHEVLALVAFSAGRLDAAMVNIARLEALKQQIIADIAESKNEAETAKKILADYNAAGLYSAVGAS